MSSIMIILTILRTMFIELDVLGVKIKLYILLFLIKLKLFKTGDELHFLHAK